jgi:hypothetical protein
MKVVGIAGEDEGHFQVVTTLVDDMIVAHIDWLKYDRDVDWLRNILDGYRAWRGVREAEPWYKYDPDDTHDLRPLTIDGVTIKRQGRIGGEPLKPEANMWRKVLLLFCHAEPRPDLVVLVRDLDGYPERRLGMEQVRDRLPWPFPVVLATPQPEIEAWLVSGFLANDSERTQLDDIRREISFDPTLESHRLTSHPNTAARDAKRVLKRLCDNDRARELACLASRDTLHARGEHNGARRFLDEVEQHIVPSFLRA